jgi:SAM-dependent methyltransferase
LAEKPGLRFGRVAEEYERVRPTYPAALVDDACSKAGVRAGEWVVEIGCGTGKLTRALVERGLSVEAVEPDADLIALARKIVPSGSVRFHDATFEDADVPGTYGAVFAATSFHWVDPEVGWQKVASLLRPGGVFALLSHVGGTKSALDEELAHVWRDVAGSTWEPLDDETLWAGVGSRSGNVAELWSWLTRHELAQIEAATLFRDVELTREPVGQTLSAEGYLARIRTANNYLHLAPGDQQRLERGITEAIEAHGGVYQESRFAVLVTARRA